MQGLLSQLLGFNLLLFQLHVRIPFLFGHIALGHIALVLGSHFPVSGALLHLFPAQTGGGESSSLLGLTCLVGLGRERGRADTVGVCGECPL